MSHPARGPTLWDTHKRYFFTVIIPLYLTILLFTHGYEEGPKEYLGLERIYFMRMKQAESIALFVQEQGDLFDAAAGELLHEILEFIADSLEEARLSNVTEGMPEACQTITPFTAWSKPTTDEESTHRPMTLEAASHIVENVWDCFQSVEESHPQTTVCLSDLLIRIRREFKSKDLGLAAGKELPGVY